MSTCKKCGTDLPEGFNFCPICGRAVIKRQSTKKRGNGQGTVIQLPNGKWKALVTLGYYTDEKGKRHCKRRCQTFQKKTDAINALSKLSSDPRKEIKQKLTFKELYDKWLPTHNAGKSTMDCYKAAIKHFEDIWFLRISDIDVDDLQECLDNCPAGKRTRENMRAVVGLMYKYGIPRHVIPDNLNLAPFLTVTGEDAAHRESFTDIEIEKIRKATGSVPFANYIYCMIYTGFRPSEFLSLSVSDYDKQHNALVGGAKTTAGKGRTVTISPKIKNLVSDQATGSGALFPDTDGKAWDLRTFTEKAFYPALEQIGINNPMVEIAGGIKRHKYSPHTCRHTFSTLMKRTAGADKDKLALIGHTSTEMLRYYQDVSYADLERITNAI